MTSDQFRHSRSHALHGNEEILVTTNDDRRDACPTQLTTNN
ncbi:hypothetical protein [Scytonema sp. NUACC26]